MRMLTTLLLSVFVIGCADQKPISYREQVQPILESKCVRCHSGDEAAGKIVLSSYETLMSSRTVNGDKPLVIAGNVRGSWLYVLASTDQPHFRMPPDTSRITPLQQEDLLVLSKWITQGAKNN